MSKIYDALIKAGKRNVTFSLEGGETIRHLSLSWQDISLEWKIVGTIGTLMLVLGLLSVATVNQLMGQALRTQIDQRALVIATNLSEAAAGHVIGRNILELHALVTKYGRLEGAAYAFIEDREGKILAHSLETFSPDLRKSLTFDERRQVERRVVRLQGRAVYETRTPMLEGQVGAAHVGIWGDGVETEIYSAIFPIVVLITIVFLAGVILFIFLARGIIRAHPPADRYGG
jgi:sensor histidine kinase regulating citrate/malate metabolism